MENVTGKQDTVQGISFREPHKFNMGNTVTPIIQVNTIMEIDCEHHIDWYDYHDAPSSINIWFDSDELLKLKELVDAAVAASNSRKEAE